jgi:hypothetical protein
MILTCARYQDRRMLVHHFRDLVAGQPARRRTRSRPKQPVHRRGIHAASRTSATRADVSYARGTDMVNSTYQWLDLTARGRQEDWEHPSGRSDGPLMSWPRWSRQLARCRLSDGPADRVVGKDLAEYASRACGILGVVAQRVGAGSERR